MQSNHTFSTGNSRTQMKYPSLVFALCSFLILASGFNVQSSTIFRQFCSPKTVGGIVSDGSNLWIATSGGAVKYTLASGAKKVFSDLSDLPDLNLVAAVQDGAGDVWFGSAEGYLIRLHPATETFTSFNALAAVQWPITCMLFFKDNIFIGSSNGLSVFSIEKGAIQNVKLFGTFTSFDVSALRSYGDTLALVTSDGIAYCVIGSMQTTIISNPSLWTCIPSAGAVGIIHQNGGLSSYGRKVSESGNMTWIYGGTNDISINGKTTGDFQSPVSCLLILDKNNSFAAGTESSFFWLYNASQNVFTQITLDGPAGSDIGGCVLDRSGLLWYVPQDPSFGIGWFNGTTWPKITYITNPEIGYMSTGMPTANNSITATSKNDIWVSTYAYGIKWFNRETDAWFSYEDPFGAQPHSVAVDPHFNPLPPPYYPSPLTRFGADTAREWWTLVSGTCEDSLGFIWVANYLPYAGGTILNVRKPRENTWRTFTYGDSAFNLLSLYTGPLASNQDKMKTNQYIYLGYVHNEAMSGGGMSVLSYTSSSGDPLTASVTCVNSDPGHIVSVNAIAVANDTLVWIASSDGIYKMIYNDPNTITKISKITSTDAINTVTAGYNGRAVFCKDRDLYAYDDGDTTLTNLTKFGRFGTSVNSIVLDKKNSVYWIASNKGLFRFDSGDSTAPSAGHAIDVYPNPMSCARLKSGHPVRFAGLDPANPTVRIYDAGGMLVMNLSDKSTRILNWNGTNQSGKVVIPGVYFYQANIGNGNHTKGKIFIIP